MRLRFGGSDPAGKPVTVEFRVTLDHVQCWVGGRVVFLDREALARWLDDPSGALARDEVMLEPAQWGLVFSFEGRVQRTVIKPADVDQLADLVSRDLPYVDTTGAHQTVRGSAAPVGAGGMS